MIKVGIINLTKGRNEPTFRPLVIYQNLFREVGIEFTDLDKSVDFLFIGMEDFIDKKSSLDHSIERGVEFLNKLNTPFFLFDGSDSTSLMGSIEVMRETNPIYLFKNQLLDFDNYKTPTSFNKWFFSSDEEPLLGYDLSQKERSKIKLTGWNLGFLHPHFRNLLPKTHNRDIDICSIFQIDHKENYDHTFRNDKLYTNHRKKCLLEVEKLKKYSYIGERKPYNEFVEVLKRSKYTLSPFGMGEVCFRDFESIMYGSLLVKPDMGKVKTLPNIYIPNVTYIPTKLDFSDLKERIDEIESTPGKREEMVRTMSNIFIETSSPITLVKYWYDIFNGLDTITTEDSK